MEESVGQVWKDRAVSKLCFWDSSVACKSHPLSRVKHAEVEHSKHTMLESLLLLFDKLSIIHILYLSSWVMHFLMLPQIANFLLGQMRTISASFLVRLLGVFLVFFFVSSLFSFLPLSRSNSAFHYYTRLPMERPCILSIFLLGSLFWIPTIPFQRPFSYL